MKEMPPPMFNMRRALTALLLVFAALVVVVARMAYTPPHFKPSLMQNKNRAPIQPIVTLTFNAASLNLTRTSDVDAPNLTNVPNAAFLNLTRLSNVGVEFYDNWNPLEGELTESTRVKIYNGFGNYLLDKDECKSANPERPAIAVRLAAQGFGRNLIQLANYIIAVGLQEKNQLFFLRFNKTLEGEVVMDYALQTWYEQRFSFVHQEGISCDVFESKCLKHVENGCHDAYWEPIGTDPTREFWKDSTAYMEVYRASNLQEHNLLKTMLLRQVMRLMPETKQELNKRHALVLAPYKFDKQIAMHVRRTDKLKEEARLVECTVFVRALDMVLEKEEFATAGNVLLHLITDESTVLAEFTQAFAGNKHKDRVTVNFRYAATRPDAVPTSDMVTESFFQVLVDYRLMISSDAYIGSQTSNLGVTSCLLRVHKHCYTVEQPYPFRWDSAKDKVA